MADFSYFQTHNISRSYENDLIFPQSSMAKTLRNLDSCLPQNNISIIVTMSIPSMFLLASCHDGTVGKLTLIKATKCRMI